MVAKIKKKPRVLLIEDDWPTIKLYQEVFEKAGFEIEILDWAQKALDLLKEVREGKRKNQI